MDRRHLVVKEAGEPIYTQGDASNACMYIVRKGSVSLSQSHNEAGPGGDGGAEGGLGEHVDALADDMDDRYTVRTAAPPPPPPSIPATLPPFPLPFPLPLHTAVLCCRAWVPASCPPPRTFAC